MLFAHLLKVSGTLRLPLQMDSGNIISFLLLTLQMLLNMERFLTPTKSALSRLRFGLAAQVSMETQCQDQVQLQCIRLSIQLRLQLFQRERTPWRT